MKSGKLFIFLFFLLLTAFADAARLSFRALTIDNGLSNFVVTSIYKDSTGYIWIGTDNSLDRFDGVNFKHYKFESGDINKKRVTSIEETTKNNLYISNGIGLWKLDLKNQKPIQLYSDIIDCRVSSLKWEPVSESLYVGSEKGLFILKENDSEPVYVPLHSNVLSNYNYITDIEIGTNDQIWVSTRKGLCCYSYKSGKIESYDNSPADELSFFAKLTRIGNKLYIGTSKKGILVFDLQTKKYSKYIDIGSDIITDLSGDGKDLLYAATDGNGVHFISTLTNQIVKSLRYNPKETNGIRSNSVYSLLVDRDGNIWTGYYQSGLDYSLYQRKVFDVYRYLPKFDSEDLPVRAFLIENNVKYIGTREGLYCINENTGNVTIIDKSVLRSNLILSLKKHRGLIYIGTYGGGVSVLDPNTMKVKPLRNDFTLTKGHVFHAETDKYGMLWLATSAGVYRYDYNSDEIVVFNNSNSQLLAGNVYYIKFDSSGKAWIATENGLCIYDEVSKTIKSNIFPKDFFNKEIIKVIYEDNKGKLYFCPDKGNMLVSDVNMREFGPYNLTQKFRDRVFLSVIQDKNKNLWIGSDNGLIEVNTKKDTYRNFTYADGVPDPLFTADAAFMDEKGNLWFGNQKGLLQLNTANLNQVTRSKFPVIFTEFYVNGSELTGVDAEDFLAQSKIKLSYNENNISVKFVSLQFTHPGTIIYEYKLEGFDDEWKVLGLGQNEVIYHDLPAGKYLLKVRTEGNDISMASQEIQISSFFNWLFWLIFILSGMIIYFFTNKIVFAFKAIKGKMETYSGISFSGDQQKADEKYKYSKISEEECQMLCQKLYDYIQNEKPFTHPDLKLSDLAQALNVSSHSLSYVFNQYLNKNYYDFINEYRIEEFKKRVVSTNSARFTLSALAEQCGFSSRASFFRSFKKLTGITPNEYIKSLGNVYFKSEED